MYKIILSLFVFGIVFSTAYAEKPQPRSKVGSAVVCEVCSLVMGVARNLLQNNATEQKITEFIDNELCQKLGGLSTVCSKFIEAEGPTILYLLARDIDPTIICKNIGLCGSSQKIEKIKEPINLGTIECSLCKLGVNIAKGLVETNVSESQIINYLIQDVCPIVKKLNASCVEYVQTNGKEVIDKILAGLDTEKICQDIKLCAGMKPEESLPKLDANELECLACEFAVHELDKLLVNNRTEQAIVQALGKVCAILPKSLQVDCTTVIKEYGIYLVDLIFRFGDDPRKICKLVTLC